MAQHLPDLRQRRARARASRSRRCGGAGAARPAPQPARNAASCTNFANQVSSDRSMRRPNAQEHAAASLDGTAAQRVRGDRLADIGGIGSRSSRACLAAHDDLPGPPIEVIQAQARRPRRPQPESGEQHQHREVTRAVKHRRSQRQQPSCTCRARVVRDRRLSRHPRDRRHGVRQRPRREPSNVQEPQQRTQRLRRALREGARLLRTGCDDERDDRRPVQPVHSIPARDCQATSRNGLTFTA